MAKQRESAEPYFYRQSLEVMPLLAEVVSGQLRFSVFEKELHYCPVRAAGSE
ncbi:hypothetical protein [Subdoligranulum variabile]|uniref:hypothetical protein n=1 Tax=Subdoligranulum variabile TaxID=214851 RepID=UPI0026ED275F|nr:hypothetical protein [Subdoligranulum variabile]